MSNSVIERSIYPESKTEIGENCVIANNVVISHDAKLKDKCLVASGTVVCGFSKLDEDSYMGVNSSVKQICKIGKHTKVGMGANVNFNTEENDIIVGSESRTLRRARALKGYNDFTINRIIEAEEKDRENII